MRGLAVLAALGLAACDQMTVQPRADAYEPSKLFASGTVNQAPPQGTVAQEDAQWEQALAVRPPMTAALLGRGRERYDIDCQQCHGLAGDGDGAVVARGFPKPPAFTDPQVEALTSRQLVDVITHGYGLMAPHADRVLPADRWAIAAYVQALQLSQGGGAHGG